MRGHRTSNNLERPLPVRGAPSAGSTIPAALCYSTQVITASPPGWRSPFDGREATRHHARLAPRARFDVVDLRSHFAAEHEALAPFRNCLYWSFHTTAGFLDRRLVARLSAQHITNYVEALRTLFPEGAGYAHDRLERRRDLDAAQRAVEPRNADSHLAFIAGGLRTCVSHPNRNGENVCWVDLDGMNDGKPRRRLTRLIAFNRERRVRSMRIDVPLSAHPIDSVNLKDPRLGIYEQLSQFVKTADMVKGRLRLALDPLERHSALTVNEYETLLMRHDLAEVLRSPLRFFAEKSRHALANPRAVPAKTLDYAKYDLVRVLNKGLDTLGLRRLDRREGRGPNARVPGGPLLPHAPLGQPARLRG